jgi:hypothetical protein
VAKNLVFKTLHNKYKGLSLIVHKLYTGAKQRRFFKAAAAMSDAALSTR